MAVVEKGPEIDSERRPGDSPTPIAPPRPSDASYPPNRPIVLPEPEESADMIPDSARRATRVWAVAGVILLLVGIGNIAIGHSKSDYYRKAIAKSIRQPPKVRLPTGEPSMVRDTIYRRRLDSRAQYYTIVFRGGALFALVGAGLLVWSAHAARAARRRDAERLRKSMP